MPDYLYIHIPFCIKKCLYCDFFSVPYNAQTAVNYTDALCKELSLKKDSAQSLKAIYIGGGTPSLLPDECFMKLFQCLRNNYHFSPDIEITIETNPGTISESKIQTLLEAGANRFSIGVQSFQDDELKFLGRIHNSGDATRTIETLIKHGIENFSIDLMYGIPGQTMDSWKASLRNAVELSPTHISTYELTLEENTPLYAIIKSDTIAMPNEDLILEMYNHTIDYLAGHGYEHYEISNFALPGFKCSHNLNYWNRGEYIGAGAGAHSFVNRVRTNNIADVNRYIDSLNSGIIPETESFMITPAESLKEIIFLGLRKTEGINAKDNPSSTIYDREALTKLIDASGELIREGYLELNEDYLRLTRKGIVISNTIIVKLFEKLGL
ncbi:MAG: radical SAM family heme chaperone HemW [Thermodesulfovibrionales bacterium]